MARRLLPVERERERYPWSIADLVSSHMGLARQTAEHKERVQAFKDKRPPKFTGR